MKRVSDPEKRQMRRVATEWFTLQKPCSKNEGMLCSVFRSPTLPFLGEVPRVQAAESNESCRFNCWRDFQTVFQVLLHSSPTLEAQAPLHPAHYQERSDFGISAVLIWAWWCLLVILILIALMSNEVCIFAGGYLGEHSFSSGGSAKWMVTSLPAFLTGLFLCLSSVLSVLCVSTILFSYIRFEILPSRLGLTISFS